MIIALFLWAQILAATTSTSTQTALEWTKAEPARLVDVDDDFRRNAQQGHFFDNIEIREVRFSENGFDWHLFRFERADGKTGPLWLVPHDDENAAFDAMITALKEHGGVGIAVNSGPDSMRMQTGSGICGVRYGVRSSCDPNRNFDAQSPRYTAAILEQRPVGQPIIALHTNSPGFAGDGHGGRGDITIIDQAAFRRGITSAREGALFAVSPSETMANFDTLGLTAYRAQDGSPSPSARECGQKIANAGVHFWHERVAKSDGSMSNYLVLNRPDIPYFNAESRAEIDVAIAAARHKVMIEAYLANCASGNQPAP
jgi:hypothetical protein